MNRRSIILHYIIFVSTFLKGFNKKLQLLGLNALQHDSKGDTVVSTADRFRNFEGKGQDKVFFIYYEPPHTGQESCRKMKLIAIGWEKMRHQAHDMLFVFIGTHHVV